LEESKPKGGGRSHPNGVIYILTHSCILMITLWFRITVVSGKKQLIISMKMKNYCRRLNNQNQGHRKQH